MKIAISESQYKRLFEQEEYVLQIPSLEYFNNDWDLLEKYLKSKGNPLYSIGGDLDLRETPIESLGNLTSVGGYLFLKETSVESLGNLISVGGDLHLRGTPIESLENLTSVGGGIYLMKTPIKSLGNLTSVGGTLDLRETPLSKMYDSDEIRKMVKVGGDLYL